jgi:hypothetical protein
LYQATNSVAGWLDAAEEAEPRMPGDLVEGRRHGLDLLVIRRDPGPHQAERRGQPVEHVDVHREVRAAQQMLGDVEARRSGADDRDPQGPGSRAEIGHQFPRSMTMVCSVSTSPWK